MKLYIINKLNEYFPELNNDINEYINDYDDIYLHLIFGDIINPYLLDLLNDSHSNYSKLLRMAELIESMSCMDIYIQEVVSTTVLERLFSENKIILFQDFAGTNTIKLIDDVRKLFK